MERSCSGNFSLAIMAFRYLRIDDGNELSLPLK
jgi:hypothetical protein